MAKHFSIYRNVRVAHPKTHETVLLRVDLDMNLDRIAAELGRKALKNKTGVVKLAIGITATAKIQP